MVDNHLQAKPILQSGKVSQLLDPSLGSDYDHEHIGRMVLATTICISRSPQARPQISRVGFLPLLTVLYPLAFVNIAELWFGYRF